MYVASVSQLVKVNKHIKYLVTNEEETQDEYCVG